MDIRNRDDDRTVRDDAPRARARRDAPTGEVVGEVVGGVSGLATGAALGALGGPIGSVIGALAGAAAGWWSGRAVSDAASTFDTEEEYYRQHFASTRTSAPDLSIAPQLQDTKEMHAVPRGTTPADVASDDPADADVVGAREYDRVRPAYQLGHLAGMNPDYRDRDFEHIEGDLRAGWTDDVSARHGRWEEVRHLARRAYERGRARSAAPRADERDPRDRDQRDRDLREPDAR